MEGRRWDFGPDQKKGGVGVGFDFWGTCGGCSVVRWVLVVALGAKCLGRRESRPTLETKLHISGLVRQNLQFVILMLLSFLYW